MMARRFVAACALLLGSLAVATAQAPLAEIPPPPVPVAEKGTPTPAVPLPPASPFPPPALPTQAAPLAPVPAPTASSKRKLFNGRLRGRLQSILHPGSRP